MRNRSLVTARVLRDGVVVSFALLLAGTIAAIAVGDSATTLHMADLRDAPAEIRAFHLPILIHLGLILLMLTPFARMVVLIYEFSRDRESAFVAISLGVLLLMIISIIIGMQ